MRYRQLLITAVLVAAGLLVAGGMWTASAAPGGQPGRPDEVPPVETGQGDDAANDDNGLGRPDNPGERGRAVSEAAHQKHEVTNLDGETVSRSLIGFCRSQAPWMSDKGDYCDDLADWFAEKHEPDGDNGTDGDGATGSQGASGAHHDQGRHLGHERAAEVASAGLGIARGFFAHVTSLLA